jgi:hypothetical protein
VSVVCAQCMFAATAVMGTASGLRSWIAARLGHRLGTATMRVVTIALLSFGVVVSGLVLSGSS